jgi:hypothetical protein
MSNIIEYLGRNLMDMNIQVHRNLGDMFYIKGLQELWCVLLIKVSDIYGTTQEVGRTFELEVLMAVTLKIAVF